MNEDWQKGILPYAIVCILILMAVFFSFYLFQIVQMQGAFSELSKHNTAMQEVAMQQGNTIDDRLFKAEIITLINRHHSASIVIKSRVLIISLSFLTGVVMTFLGSIFILGKFSESTTSIEGTAKEMKIALASSSPGIILSTLGIILISISILSKTNLAVTDKPVYLNINATKMEKTYPIDSSDIEKLEELTMSSDSTDSGTRKP